MTGKKKFASGFLNMISEKMKRKKQQQREEDQGKPSGYYKMSDTDRRRMDAIDRANKKRKKRKYGM